jgi:hypothetical protein
MKDKKQNSKNPRGSLDKLVAKRIKEITPKPHILSQMAYQRDLPELLKSNGGWWTAYLKDTRIALLETRESIEKFCDNYCKKNKVDLDDLAVNQICPEPSQKCFL